MRGFSFVFQISCSGQAPIIVPPLRVKRLTASALRTAIHPWMPVDKRTVTVTVPVL